MDRINNFFREFLTTGKINDLCLFIIKSVSKKQNVKITLDIAVNAAFGKVDIAVCFEVDAQYYSFLRQKIISFPPYMTALLSVPADSSLHLITAAEEIHIPFFSSSCKMQTGGVTLPPASCYKASVRIK
jgi:hypothetical protein